jgi:hypothetical protein
MLGEIVQPKRGRISKKKNFAQKSVEPSRPNSKEKEYEDIKFPMKEFENYTNQINQKQKVEIQNTIKNNKEDPIKKNLKNLKNLKKPLKANINQNPLQPDTPLLKNKRSKIILIIFST